MGLPARDSMPNGPQQQEQPEEAKRDNPFPKFNGYTERYTDGGEPSRVTARIENSETGVNPVEYHVKFSVRAPVYLRGVTTESGEKVRLNAQSLEAVGFAIGFLEDEGFDLPDVYGTLEAAIEDGREEEW